MFNALKKACSYAPMLIFLYALMTAYLNKSINLFQVEEKTISTYLNFTGFANPIDSYTIDSPIDGVVKAVLTDYGSFVRQGQSLFSVQSDKLNTDFRSAIETYLKAKETYQSALFSFNGNKELYKLGLISKVAYLSSENQLQDSNLALREALEGLQKLASLAKVDLSKIKALSIDEMDKFFSLAAQVNQGIRILAQHEGRLLFPTKTLVNNGDLSSGNDGGPLKRGSRIKEGQVIAVIANMTGLRLEITFSENDFQNIFIGQKAKISFPAFSNIQLEGKVSSINYQANNADSTAVPSYNADVIVPSLTKEASKNIQVGMSVQVTLVKDSSPKIMIPIQALSQKDGQYFVTIKNASTQKLEKKPVTTGETDTDSVEILSGLKSGDELVLPN